MHIHLFTLRSPTPSLPVVLTASQSNSSLKKQRSRSIFSTFFCCFRNYNVDPPATNTNTSSQPPPVEENGSPPKVNCCSKHMLFVWVFSLSSWTLFCLFFFVLLPTPHPVFVSVCLSLLCCSVTRSRSSLSLVYVLPFFLSLCMQAEWAGAGTSCLCGLQCSSESFCSATVPYCGSFSADRSTGCVEGVYAPMGLNGASVPDLHE